MVLALALFAVVIAALSLFGVLAPRALTAFVSSFMQRPAGMPVAVLARIVLAVLLWFSAPASRTPLAFQVIAAIAIAAAIALPFIGTRRLQRLIDWFAAFPEMHLRLWCLFGVAFAGYLLWALYPALAGSG